MTPFSVHGRQPTATVWITRESKAIKVCDLDNEHLLNIVRMLRRWAKKVEAKEIERAAVADGRGWDESDFEVTQEWILNSVSTWPRLLQEISARCLTELPWEE